MEAMVDRCPFCGHHDPLVEEQIWPVTRILHMTCPECWRKWDIPVKGEGDVGEKETTD